jgi:hypothetical protein
VAVPNRHHAPAGAAQHPAFAGRNLPFAQSMPALLSVWLVRCVMARNRRYTGWIRPVTVRRGSRDRFVRVLSLEGAIVCADRQRGRLYYRCRAP